MKRLAKTYWEARWTPRDRGSGESVQRFDEHKSNGENESACRLFAMNKAIELKGGAPAYDTAVHVYEVELHEEMLDTYTNQRTQRLLNPERVSGTNGDTD